MNNFHFNDNNGNLNSKDEEKYEDHSTLETPSNFNKIKSPFQLSLEIDEKDNDLLLTDVIPKLSSPLRANAPEYPAKQTNLFGGLVPSINIPANPGSPFRGNTGRMTSEISFNQLHSPTHSLLSSQSTQSVNVGTMDPMSRWPTATRSQIPMTYSLKARQNLTQESGFDQPNYGIPPGISRNQDDFLMSDSEGGQFESYPKHVSPAHAAQSRLYSDHTHQELLTPSSVLNRGLLDPLRSFRQLSTLDSDDRLFMNMGNDMSSRSELFNREMASLRTPTKKDVKAELVSADGYIYKVHFKRAARNFVLHRFASMNIKPGDFVKVEADRGEDLGVVIEKVPASEFKEFMPTAGYRGRGFSTGQTEKKSLMRLATLEECAQLAVKFDDEERALEIIRCKVAEFMLPMIILDAEYQYDRHKLVFFFEADKRVDFRELVSDLFSLYKTRIWMQQVDTSTIPDDELDGDFTKSPLFFHAPSRAPILSHQHKQLLALQPNVYANQDEPSGGDRLYNASLSLENRELASLVGDASPIGELGSLFNSNSSWSYGDN